MEATATTRARKPRRYTAVNVGNDELEFLRAVSNATGITQTRLVTNAVRDHLTRKYRRHLPQLSASVSQEEFARADSS